MQYKFWLDTETTGLKSELNQILEYAVIVEDINGTKVDELEVKIKLRSFVRPSPEALAANNINPYEDSWTSQALSEEKAADLLAELCEKYTVEGDKPIFIAYNASFDVDHIRMMFKRHGIVFENCFSSLVVDPLKTVKGLVSSNVIETKKITKGKKTYSSSKLEDVSVALNLATGKPAHRALNDVETLILVTKAAYKLITGKEMSSAKCNPNLYKQNDVVHIVTESTSSGLKKRYIKVIKNTPEKKQFIAFDLSDYERIGLAPSNVRTFNYVTVVDELPLDPVLAKKTEEIYAENTDYIKGKVQS